MKSSSVKSSHADAATPNAHWLLFAGFMTIFANGVGFAIRSGILGDWGGQFGFTKSELGGMIVGGLFAYFFCGSGAILSHLRWEIPMAVFLVPTLIYGAVVLKETFPRSEAAVAGVSASQMLACFASPVLLCLLVLHAMIGYVELGTDS